MTTTKQVMIFAGAILLTAAPLSLPAAAQASKPAASMPFVTEQPASEWLARVFLGAAVMNATGERVGDIQDLVFNRSGQISTVVLGVGGFLGMGEKNVAIPFSALTYTTAKDGARVILVALSKDALKQAPAFKAIEKTTLDAVKDKAADISHKTVDKAVELKDQAARKIDDMTKSATVKQ